MSVYDSAQAYRRRLAARDAQAAGLIASYYTNAWLEIRRRLRTLVDRMTEAQAAGQPVKPAWLFQQDAYQQLLGQIGLEIDQFTRLSGQVVTAAQADAISLAIEAARDLTEAQIRSVGGVAGVWVNLSSSTVEQLAGALERGPLAQLLAPFPRRAQEAAKSALVTAVALGDNPRKVEGRLREALGITKVRALTISRTEILRANREATRLAYQANPHTVERWQWLSAMDERTCPACWAMTGTVHDVSEPLGSHPQCRCTLVPIPPLFAALEPGVPHQALEQELVVPNGVAAFERLAPAAQERVLGPAAYREYVSGRLQLAELVGYHDHPEWGPTRYTRSLRSIGITTTV